MRRAHSLQLSALFLLAFLAGCKGKVEQTEDKPETGGQILPSGILPSNALAVLHFNVPGLLESEPIKAFRQAGGADLLAGIEKTLGVELTDLDSITLLFAGPEKEPLAILRSRTPHLKAKVEVAHKIVKANDGVFLFGPPDVTKYFLAKPNGLDDQGYLNATLREAAAKHHIVAEVVPTRAWMQSGRGNLPPELQSLLPLLEMKSVTLTLDLDKETDLTLGLFFADEAQAGKGEDAARQALSLLRTELARAIAQIGRGGTSPLPPSAGGGVRILSSTITDLSPDPATARRMLQQLEAALAGAEVERQDAVVQVKTRAAIDFTMLAKGTGEVRGKASREMSRQHLRDIMVTLHAYVDDHGALPPPAILSKDGKPLLSWRVAILPYLEQEELFKQFKLDEPWDSPINRKLLEKMPKVYGHGGASSSEPYTTYYRALVGKGAAFEANRKLRFADFADGPANTVMVVEAAEPVPWTKPDEILCDPDQPLPRLGGVFPDGFQAGFADGNIRFLKKDLDPKVLRALITRNGGEVLPGDY